MFDTQPDPVLKLRALWSLYVMGAASREFLEAQLGHPNEHVRVWAIRLLADFWPIDTVLSQRPDTTRESSDRGRATVAAFVRLAKQDSSGLVRLALASTLQRLPVAERVSLGAALSGRREDASDQNLPLLIWYGLIPVADSDPGALSLIAAKCELPITRRFIARRLAEDIEKNPFPLDQLIELASAKPETFQRDLLDGMGEALKGWRKALKPAAWDPFARNVALSAKPDLNERVRNLSVLFGDGRALEDVRKIALDPNADLPARKSALQTLIDSKPPDLRAVCERLVSVSFLNPVAARGLAAFDDPEAAAKLVRAYRQFHLSERPQLLSTLVTRVSLATELLKAVAEGRIPRSDLSAFHARQIRSLNDPLLNKKLGEVWGDLRASPGGNVRLMAQWKRQLTPATLAKANLGQGRAVFNLACAPCHTLYGEGGKLGPDLSGAGRDNLDYLLENIADPSAVVTADFRMSVIKMKDGRTLNGLISAKTDRTVTLQTMTETLTLERGEVESIEVSSLSLMPEGLLEGLKPAEARDLIGYLMHQTQVPMPRP